MKIHSPAIRNLFIEIGALVLVNLLIAFFLYLINFTDNLVVSIIDAQLIGISIFAAVRTSYPLLRYLHPMFRLLVIFTALGLGAITGFTLSRIILDGRWPSPDEWSSPFNLQVLLISLLCGTVVSYLFISQKMLREIRATAQEEKINRLASEKQALELELRLLQAQVEPHFLFNTLSTIHSLLATDLPSAEKMLLCLSDFLRTSLTLCRQERITVADELKLLRSYLEIFKIRLGRRLEYQLSVRDEAGGRTIPPMLIQPLVENCIKHGLEPTVAGGTIEVTISLADDLLQIEVADTGQGLQAAQSAGLGTRSVRRRIESLYGKDPRAGVEFRENSPTGLRVKMTLPPLPDGHLGE
jgi:sensor histidine kinase YesM